MGHRNPQCLYFDKENNYILETEHGPMGADEINLIELNKNDKNEIPNYGWAIASAGIHYGASDGVPNKSYEKYPLYKSHKEHGFIEPAIQFSPSIAPSEIVFNIFEPGNINKAVAGEAIGSRIANSS